MPRIFQIAFFLSVFIFHYGSSIASYSGADLSLSQKLEKGQGGFILKFSSYVTAKKWADLSTSEMKEVHSRSIMLLVSSPDPNKKEKMIRVRRGAFEFIGPPGKYTITRLVVSLSMTMAGSMRLMKEIVLEPGKIKYIGELVAIGNNGLFGKALVQPSDFLFKPEEFKAEFSQDYPITSKYLFTEPIFEAPSSTETETIDQPK